MTHLEEAIAAMERYEDLRNRDSSHAAEMALKARDTAAVWAAIAQAQALERIADALESVTIQRVN
jgi:hypothetical protein